MKLLLSVNCQTTVAFRAILSYLSVRRTVNSTISPNSGVRHTVTNVNPPHLTFSGGSLLRKEGVLCSVTTAFRAAEILLVVAVDIHVDWSFES